MPFCHLQTITYTYLQLDGELYLAPGFPLPPNTDYKGYHSYIDECLPPETPYLYGLHPNAEIEFLTSTSDNMFRVVFEMQPRDSGAGAGGGVSREEKVGLCTQYCCHLKDLSENDTPFFCSFYYIAAGVCAAWRP